RIKLYVTQTALHFRREHPNVFFSAPYTPIPVEGAKAENVCAFIRQYEGVRVLIVVPRLPALLTGGETLPPMGEVWGETVLRLDEWAGRATRNLFTDEVISLESSTSMAALLKRFPVGLFQID